MVYFWNIIHYFIYRGQYKFHLFFNRINPFILLFKLPHAKKQFKKLGVDPMQKVNEAFKRPDTGIASIWAWGYMQALFMICCLGFINFFSGIIQKELNLTLYHFIFLGGLTLTVNYFFLFKHDKYLIYFDEFDKMPKDERKQWRWISITTVFVILLWGIGSFIFIDYRL
jgi:hypothetical protein